MVKFSLALFFLTITPIILYAQDDIGSSILDINNDEKEMKKIEEIAYANAPRKDKSASRRLLFPSNRLVLQQIQNDVRRLRQTLPFFAKNISMVERELVNLKRLLLHYEIDGGVSRNEFASIKKNTNSISKSVNHVQRAQDRVERMLHTLIFNITTNISGLYENVRGNYDEYQELSTNLSDVSQRINNAHSIWPVMEHHINASDAKLLLITSAQDRLRNILLQQGHQILSELGKMSQKIDMIVYEVNTESSKMHNELVNFLLSVLNQLTDLRRMMDMQRIGIPNSFQNSSIIHLQDQLNNNTASTSSFHYPMTNDEYFKFSNNNVSYKFLTPLHSYHNPFKFSIAIGSISGIGSVHEILGTNNILGSFGGVSSFIFFLHFNIPSLFSDHTGAKQILGDTSIHEKPIFSELLGFPEIPGFPSFPAFPDPGAYHPLPYVPTKEPFQGQLHPIYPSYPLYPPIIPDLTLPGVSTDGFPEPPSYPGSINGLPSNRESSPAYSGQPPTSSLFPNGWTQNGRPTIPSYPSWQPPFNDNDMPHGPSVQNGTGPPVDSGYPTSPQSLQPNGPFYPNYSPQYPGGPPHPESYLTETLKYPTTTQSYYPNGHDSYPGKYPDKPYYLSQFTSPDYPGYPTTTHESKWMQTPEPILIPPGIILGDGVFRNYCVCICACDCKCPVAPNDWLPDQHVTTATFQSPTAFGGHNNKHQHGRWSSYPQFSHYGVKNRCNCLCPCNCPSHMLNMYSTSSYDNVLSGHGNANADGWVSPPSQNSRPLNMYPGRPSHDTFPSRQPYNMYPNEPPNGFYHGKKSNDKFPIKPSHELFSTRAPYDVYSNGKQNMYSNEQQQKKYLHEHQDIYLHESPHSASSIEHSDASSGPPLNSSLLRELRQIKYDINAVRDEVGTARAAIIGVINGRMDETKYFLSDMHHATLAHYIDNKNNTELLTRTVNKLFQDVFYILNTITNYAVATSTDIDELTQHMRYPQQIQQTSYPNYKSVKTQNYTKFRHENQPYAQPPTRIGKNKTKIDFRHDFNSESQTIPTINTEMNEISHNDNYTDQCIEEEPSIENKLRLNVNYSEQFESNYTKINCSKDDDSFEEIDLPDVGKLLNDEDRFTSMALDKGFRPFRNRYIGRNHHINRPRKLKSKHRRRRPYRKLHRRPFMNTMLSRLISNLHPPISMYSPPIIPMFPNFNSLLANLGVPSSMGHAIIMPNSQYKIKPMMQYNLLPNLPNLQNMPSMPHMQNLPVLPNLPGLSGFPVSPGFSGFPGSPDLSSLVGSPSSSGLPGLPGLPNVPALPNLPREILSAAQEGKPFSASYADGQGNQWNINVNNRRFSVQNDDENDDADANTDVDVDIDIDIAETTTENLDSLNGSNID